MYVCMYKMPLTHYVLYVHYPLACSALDYDNRHALNGSAWILVTAGLMYP